MLQLAAAGINLESTSKGSSKWQNFLY